MRDLDWFFDLLSEKGFARYGGEQVSQLQHALQCALLAEQAGAEDRLITAALFHDIGHLTTDDEGLAEAGRDARHEVAGANALSRVFSPEVTDPIRYHVDAKRYLCATDGTYQARLSAASRTSLQVQGDAMTAEEARRFESKASFEEAVQLRRWDDDAKWPDATTPDLQHFRPAAERLSRPWRQGRLFLVVGASGAGKDSLIEGAKQRLADDPRYLFPRRVVTRPEDAARERHESVGEAEFEAMEAADAFFLVWKAHGFRYGVPASVTAALAQGRRVVVNVSRSVVAEACRHLPNVQAIHVTASPAVRANRLSHRGSEARKDQQDRLARSVAWSPEEAALTEVNNDGQLHEGVAAFLRALGRQL